MTTYIAVCGGSTADDDALAAAEQVGRLIAQAGAVLITGGQPLNADELSQ